MPPDHGAYELGLIAARIGLGADASPAMLVNAVVLLLIAAFVGSVAERS